MRRTILSRHRLPKAYRYSITALWLAPILLLILTALAGKGFSFHLLDLRFLIPLALMTVPALYIWQEGVDVLPDGIHARVHIPRYYDYSELGTWDFDARLGRRVLAVWDVESRKVLECRAGHLTDLPLLLASLKDNVRERRWHS